MNCSLLLYILMFEILTGNNNGDNIKNLHLLYYNSSMSGTVLVFANTFKIPYNSLEFYAQLIRELKSRKNK